MGDFVQGRVEVLVPLALPLFRGGALAEGEPLGTHLNEAKHRPVVLVQLAVRGVGQRLRRARGPLAWLLSDRTKIRVGFGFWRKPYTLTPTLLHPKRCTLTLHPKPCTLTPTLHPKPGLSDRTKIRMSVL